MTLSVGFDRRLERLLVLRFICELSTPWAMCRGEGSCVGGRFGRIRVGIGVEDARYAINLQILVNSSRLVVWFIPDFAY